jgi:hypothetical protein
MYMLSVYSNSGGTSGASTKLAAHRSNTALSCGSIMKHTRPGWLLSMRGHCAGQMRSMNVTSLVFLLCEQANWTIRFHFFRSMVIITCCGWLAGKFRPGICSQ